MNKERDATPVQIRQTFNIEIDAFLNTAHMHARHIEAAKNVRASITAYPFLRDQIPHDVLGLALRACACTCERCSKGDPMRPTHADLV